MSAIRAKDTKPELTVRRALHRAGFRYRLHSNDLPGKPDLVFAKHQAVVFIHGCFWHKHSCPAFKLPASRRAFWEQKIDSNVRRDAVTRAQLLEMGWRVGTVWECALRGKGRLSGDEVADLVGQWLQGSSPTIELSQNHPHC